MTKSEVEKITNRVMLRLAIVEEHITTAVDWCAAAAEDMQEQLPEIDSGTPEGRMAEAIALAAWRAKRYMLEAASAIKPFVLRD
ncbi:MAG: hypothetical protein M0R74_09105 [Dehalococcoidia bacterium]|jgi:hypothetical protein|nr:hypothetical protein [Dehalococcoidia bacterium]